MRYINLTPEYFAEHNTCEAIHYYLNFHIDDDVTLHVRGWDQNVIMPSGRYVSVVTSAEGHQYIPPEADDPNCLGVFMHYYPKKNIKYQFDNDNFMILDNIYPLPLGTTKFFTGNDEIPINDRPINVSFIGQLDPYRRADFYDAIERHSELIENSVFHFYEGWNKGVGNKYSEIMSNTKIALVPCGSASLDTFRFYEAACCGCIILTLDQNMYDFMIDAMYVKLKDWDKLDIGINLLLQDPATMSLISNQTSLFWKNRISPFGSSKYILDKIKVNNV